MTDTHSCLKQIGNDSVKPRVLLLRTDEVTIGREKPPFVTFSILSPRISRVHAVLRKVEDVWTITDQSMNGTEINGKRLSQGVPAELHDEDIVALGGDGNIQFRFVSKVRIRQPRKRDKSNQEDVSSKRAKKLVADDISSQASSDLDTSGSQSEHSLESVVSVVSRSTAPPSSTNKPDVSSFPQNRTDAPMASTSRANVSSPPRRTKVPVPSTSRTDGVPMSPQSRKNAPVAATSRTDVVGTPEQRADVSVLSRSRAEASPRPGSGRDELLEMKRQEEERRREFEEKLAAMQRQLEEKEREQAAMKVALEEERKVNTDQAKALSALRDKETKMKLEFDMFRETVEKEKGQVERRMRSELETLVQQREAELLQQMKEKQEALQAEKQEVEARLKQVMETELSERNKQMEEELEKERTRLEQALAGKELAQRALEAKLRESEARNEDQSEQQELHALQSRQELLSCFTELVETELQCSICNELFVKATSLNCSHSFCEYCIQEWMKRKMECPICRTKISSQMYSRVIDSYIDKVVDALSDDLKRRREDVITARREEHRRREEEAAMLAAVAAAESSYARARGRRRGRGRTRGQGRGQGQRGGQVGGGNAGTAAAPIVVESPRPLAPVVIREPVEVSSDSSDSDDDDMYSEDYDHFGTPCSYCGETGHDHDECPFMTDIEDYF